MEEVSFIFIFIGSIFIPIISFLKLGEKKINKNYFIICIIVSSVAITSYFDIFIGPIGDAREYHKTINSCFGNFLICGDKLHEIIWGLLSSLIGPLWGFLYGVLVTFSLKFVAINNKDILNKKIYLTMFLYSIYQIGNGMAEGTYFLLVLLALYFFSKHHIASGTVTLFLSFIAHLGNLPLLIYLWKYKSKLYKVFFIITGVIIIIIANNAELDKETFFSSINKGGASVKKELILRALESKTKTSIRYADTSYAETLLEAGFPSTTKSLILALVYYVAPILASNDSIIETSISMLSFVMSIAIIILSRKKYLLITITFLYFFVFGIATFTPGIGLRHKVPLFLFLLSISSFTENKLKKL